MNSKQLGRFTLPKRLIDFEPSKVADLFAALRIVPVRVEVLYWHDKIVYEAICDKFRTLNIGESMPTYRIDIKEYTVTEEGE